LGVAAMARTTFLRGTRPDVETREPEPTTVSGWPSVSVVIPALNEAGSIGWVLRALPAWVSEVVLVDGLSTDDTEEIARTIRPDLVVVHQPRPGKGAALRAGFAASTGDIIVMIDADGSTDPAEMHRFVSALRDGAEFVKGSRHVADGGSEDFTALRRAGNRAFVTLVNRLYGSSFTDLCYGYCAFWRDKLESLALTADGFEIETELVLNAVRAGLDIREVPSFELVRRAGKSNLNAVRDGCRVLRTIVEHRSRRPATVAAATEISTIELERIVLGPPAPSPRRGAVGTQRVDVVYRAVEQPAGLQPALAELEASLVL
jgi:hypothetical protein